MTGSLEGGEVSGEPLDPGRIKKARREEMDGAQERGVYKHVLREEARKDTSGKFIGVQWVDHNKGTQSQPQLRSRLVGQEFANGQRRDDLYAPTPPLSAARYMLSRCASHGHRYPENNRILLMDIKTAFLYGYITRNVYIELPQGDPAAIT